MLTASLSISRMTGRRRGEDLPPPPTMAEVLLLMEEGRVRSDRLLEQLVHQGNRRNNDCHTLTEFLRSQPPSFSDAKEPLTQMTGCVHWSASSPPCMFPRWSRSTSPLTYWRVQRALGGKATRRCSRLGMFSLGRSFALPSTLPTYPSPSWS